MRFMHPQLYRSLLAIAFTFLILALIPLPILVRDPNNPSLIVDLIGIALLVLFIVGITWEFKRQQRTVKLSLAS